MAQDETAVKHKPKGVPAVQRDEQTSEQKKLLALGKRHLNADMQNDAILNGWVQISKKILFVYLSVH